MKQQSVLDFLLSTIAIACGALVVVLTVINQIDTRISVLLLAVAICCVGFSAIDLSAPLGSTTRNKKKR